MGRPIKTNRIFNDHLMPNLSDHCIYQLIDDSGNVFYVGQTGDLRARICAHIYHHRERLSSFSFEVVSKSDANNFEAAMIAELRPELNKDLPTNEFYMTKLKLKRNLIEMVSAFIDELDSDFEIPQSKKLNQKHILAYKGLIIEGQISDAISESKNMLCEHF